MLGRTVFRSKSRRAQFREEHLRKAWEASERSELKDVVVTDETAVRFRRSAHFLHSPSRDQNGLNRFGLKSPLPIIAVPLIRVPWKLEVRPQLGLSRLTFMFELSLAPSEMPASGLLTSIPGLPPERRTVDPR